MISHYVMNSELIRVRGQLRYRYIGAYFIQP